MCPFCLANMGPIVVGALATALTALAVKVSRNKNEADEIPLNPDEKEK
jgi:hypothetical protein